ncbi:hypothetical protein HS041_28660 [Planomonospora sp. ID67723]|uniref:hypothetical protein n=1 Tax=Planomonospora sp. ID67723 TaxID=2738134 RepID=UPI0018C41B30|nr:hypothetical protein [Planomonospora sp. ID67723]MBG0831704.1 hypothetical protein [Planomonospora sp. ID67723]
MARSAADFSRRFTKDVGITPGRYVEQIRVRAAQVLLETRDDTSTLSCCLLALHDRRATRRRPPGGTPDDPDQNGPL